MAKETYKWTDNPTVSGVSKCDTDILNDCLMHLKYDKQNGGNGHNLFDMKISDRILLGEEALGWAMQGSLVTMTYPDAVNKIKELYATAVETTHRGIECRRTIDGRYITDISQQIEVDKLFVTTGVADFYVLDSMNNQFYLPKTDKFLQITNNTENVNNYNEAGLPNITGTVHTCSWTNTAGGQSGAFQNSYALPQGASNGDQRWVASFDASRSSNIYGKSDTVQPISSLKLLYYKVGESIVNSDKALIDAQQLLSESLKTVAAETEASVQRLKDTSNPLNRNQVSNCLLETPERVKVELNNGTLTLKSGSVVIVPYGTSAPALKIGDSFNNGTIVDISWDGSRLFYYVEYDTDKQKSPPSQHTGSGVCYLDHNGAINYYDYIYCYSGDTDTSTDTYRYWYDTSQNLIKVSKNSGDTWTDGLSFPIVIGTVNTNGGYATIDYIFNGFGFIGSIVWADKSIKALAPNGRNTDGSFKNIEYTTEFIHVSTLSSALDSVKDCMLITTDVSAFKAGTVVQTEYTESKTKPAVSEISVLQIWYNIDENRYFYISKNNNINDWTPVYAIKLGTVEIVKSGTINSANFIKTFRAVDYNEFQSTPHIVKTYRNGTSWYRIWSDGWIEQGDYNYIAGSRTVSLLKPFSSTNYHVGGCCSNGATYFGLNAITNGSFLLNVIGLNCWNWYACGY